MGITATRFRTSTVRSTAVPHPERQPDTFSAPNGLWMTQIARNLTDAVDGFFAGKRYLIHDRDPLYTKEFLTIVAGFGIESIKLPPRSPNLLPMWNGSFVRSKKAVWTR